MSKKGGKPKTKAKAAAADEHVVTRQIVLANYGKLCKSIGVPVNTHVNDVLRGPAEEEQEIVNFILEGEIGALGPGSVRAIALAFLIRIWNQDVGNEGAAAIGMLLQSTAPSINIAYLELLDCEIGEAGCKAISEIVSTQKTPGLLTLNLDYNSDIGDHGVTALCDGLFSNTILKKLHLDYCGIGPRGAVKLAQFLSMPQSALDTLSLNGNALGDEGLYHLSLGLARSQHLTSINLADNGIRHDEEALTAFRDALLRSKVLAHVDFTYNPIDVLGAMLLLPALTPENTKIQSFQVDSSLPAELFAQLNRAAKGDGKKKGKKKGGKKKK